MAISKKRESFYSSIVLFVQKHKYALLVISILLLCLFLRSYNYPNRWGLGNDDARDIAIAQEALKRQEIPLIGSFSSAGPFVFGPFFYWYIMGTYIFLPFAFTAPWIFLILIGVATVGVLMLTAYKLEGRNFALLVGLIAAVSPQIVLRSLTLGQHTFIAFLTSLLLFILMILYKKPNIILALVYGFVLGSAINFHWQALNLLLFLVVLFFLPKLTLWMRFVYVVVGGLGVLLGLLPLILWDIPQQFANFRNLLDYFLVGQHRLYVPNSWKLYLFTYLPQYWSLVIGGYTLIGLIVMGITGMTFFYAIVRRKLHLQWFYLLIPFGIFLFLNRFYKGERSEGYLLYLLPIIILCSSYAIYSLFQTVSHRYSLNKIASILLLFLIITGNALQLKTFLAMSSPVSDIEQTVRQLKKAFPNQKFAVYDYQYLSPYQSQPLSILLSRENLSSRTGIPIGVVCYQKCSVSAPFITSVSGAAVVDLRQEASLSARKKEWVRLTPEDMYDDLIGWSKKHELTSTFTFDRYLKEKFK